VHAGGARTVCQEKVEFQLFLPEALQASSGGPQNNWNYWNVWATIGTGFVQIVMELLYRYGELKVSVVYRVSDGLNGLNGLNCLNEQRLIAERFGGLDEGLVSRDRRPIREKIESEPKIRKWFQDLTRLST
jgi:hypothetical protein